VLERAGAEAIIYSGVEQHIQCILPFLHRPAPEEFGQLDAVGIFFCQCRRRYYQFHQFILQDIKSFISLLLSISSLANAARIILCSSWCASGRGKALKKLRIVSRCGQALSNIWKSWVSPSFSLGHSCVRLFCIETGLEV